MLFLLDSDGQVFASQRESNGRQRSLPFGLQCVVNRTITQSRDVFAAGEADFIVDLPLVVRIFSIKHDSSSTIALYIERACRRADSRN